MGCRPSAALGGRGHAARSFWDTAPGVCPAYGAQEATLGPTALAGLRPLPDGSLGRLSINISSRGAWPLHTAPESRRTEDHRGQPAGMS